MTNERDSGSTGAAPIAEELRQLGQAISALGRTVFQGGRVLSVELLRSVRGIVESAREEIEKMTAEKK